MMDGAVLGVSKSKSKMQKFKMIHYFLDVSACLGHNTLNEESLTPVRFSCEVLMKEMKTVHSTHTV